MRDRLKEFASHVRKAPMDQASARIVRIMLAKVAEDCPMHVLVKLGKALVDARAREIRDEAESN